MTEEIKYFILGLIQGLAEFFPISSSGHIVLYSSIMGIAEKHPLLLSIVVHFATTLSTIVVYRDKIRRVIIGLFKHRQQSQMHFVLQLVISTLPIIFVGIFFRNNIEALFHNATHLVCLMLVFTGIVLMLTNNFNKGNKKITFKSAFIIGLAQALAILPGISRSGLTIATAVCLKIDRKLAAEFSFLMALIPIIGISLIEIYLLISLTNLHDINIAAILIAFFTAFFSGLFACKHMIKIVQNNNLNYFGYYCILIGIFFFWFL
tara:strand:- start:143 stop:931 length:789 start_codon:yes stop_codon:yes gene_type:complete